MADDFWEEFGDFFANINWGELGEAAGSIAAAYAVSSLLNQQKKVNTSGLVSTKQSYAPATVFVGDYSRSSGSWPLRYAKGNVLYEVRAISDGRLDSYGGFWLHDDKVTLGFQGRVTSITNQGATIDDGRYIDDRVFIEYRLGLPTETAYAGLVSALPTLWSNNHRGDDVGSVYMRCPAPIAKFFRQAFPNHAPELSVSARGVCYDWRKDSTAGGVGSQRRNTPSTWAWSANPVVWLVHLEWYRWGMDWNRRIAPVLADLTAEANICDEPIALKAGGTEPRYRVAFNYQPAVSQRNDIRRVLLDSMAGRYGRTPRGHLVVRAGKYRPPTVTIEQKYIIDHQFDTDIESDEIVNEYHVTVIDPVSDFNEIEIAPVAFGGGGKTASLKFEGVYSQTQGQRLAKIKYYEGIFPIVPITFTDRGLSVFGEWSVEIENPDWPGFESLEVEPIGPVVRDADFTVSMGYRRIIPEAWEWDAATEEADLVTSPDRPDVAALDAPEIDSIVVIGTAGLPRLRVTATGDDLGGNSWVVFWRVTGEDAWVSETFTDYVNLGSGQVQFDTAIIEAAASVDVQVQFVTAGRTPSPRSLTATVDTTAPVTVLNTPTGLTLSTPVSGTIGVQVTASNSVGSIFTAIYRNTTNNFGTATLISRPSTAPSQTVTYNDTGRTPATTYYYWAQAEGINALSSPTAVQSIVAT